MVKGQHGNEFSRNSLVEHLDACEGRTLGDLDIVGDFKRTAANEKITGIAGDVVEHSVLGLSSNSRQEPDIVVDGVKYEVKTTGVRESRRGHRQLEAKEPMSITAVSPEKITEEMYNDSSFLHKIAHLLLFYYLYDSKSTVKASEYARFPLLTYQFHEYSDYTQEERDTLMSDWQKVKNFIVFLQEHHSDYEKEYPRLSYELRQELMLLDTAPKWPHRPRFRFKRTFVTSIYQRHAFKRQKKEALPEKYTEIHDIYDKCHELVVAHRGKTVQQMCDEFSVTVSRDIALKSIAEPIIVKMFGGTRHKMRDIELFSKIGLVGKSIVLTQSGKRTEDTKFFTIDFDEFSQRDLEFEDSQFYEFFSSHKILFVVFEEPSQGAPLTENVFVGFSLVTFSEDFIQCHVRPVWERVRYLVRNQKLRESPVLKKDGTPVVNKNGVVSTELNFPKSSEGVVFVRGTGTDSNDKRECVNGIRMYYQQLWVKGSYMAELVGQSYTIPPQIMMRL